VNTVLAAAMGLVLVHRLDGGDVLINPKHVTSLHSQALPRRKLYPVTAHCVVGLLDGMRLSVLEPCATVREILDAAAPDAAR
jgi:hypothetical protein